MRGQTSRNLQKKEKENTLSQSQEVTKRHRIPKMGHEDDRTPDPKIRHQDDRSRDTQDRLRGWSTLDLKIDREDQHLTPRQLYDRYTEHGLDDLTASVPCQHGLPSLL